MTETARTPVALVLPVKVTLATSAAKGVAANAAELSAAVMMAIAAGTVTLKVGMAPTTGTTARVVPGRVALMVLLPLAATATTCNAFAVGDCPPFQAVCKALTSLALKR